MKKIIRNFTIEEKLDWGYGIEISVLREELNRLEELGATHIEIEAYDNYGCACLDIFAYSHRLETDEECAERIRKKEEHEARIKEMELEQLHKLKEKYNDLNKEDNK